MLVVVAVAALVDWTLAPDALSSSILEEDALCAPVGLKVVLVLKGGVVNLLCYLVLIELFFTGITMVEFLINLGYNKLLSHSGHDTTTYWRDNGVHHFLIV